MAGRIQLMTLATAVRERSQPPVLPPLRQTQTGLVRVFGGLVSDETALIVDSIETMAELLGKDMDRLPRQGRHPAAQSRETT